MSLFQLYDIHGPIGCVEEATVATVGVFDGVHLGHRDLLRQLADLHAPGNPAPLAVTLTVHPSYVLGRRQSEYWLDDPQEHLRLLFATGVRYVATLPFTPEVASLSACRLARLLFDEFHMRHLLLGYDSRFGNRRDDDFALLPQLAANLGFTIAHGTPLLVEGSPVSSSRIRASLEQGTVEDTAALLGRPYSLAGPVAHGRGVGRTLGFPTANIDLSQSRKMLPREGVYAVLMAAPGALPAPLPGIANLGSAPTFGIGQPLLEVHLPGFDGDLYGVQAHVAFIRRLRDTVRFGSPDDLRRQIEADKAAALNHLRQHTWTP